MITRALRTFEVVARVWCNVMHPDPAWPIHGYYRCPKCHRKYRVPWESRNGAHNMARPDKRAAAGVEPEFATAA